MASVVLRVPGNVELPVNFDYQRQLATFLDCRLPSDEILFARWQMGQKANPLTCDNSPEILTPPFPPLPTLNIGELQWPSGASRYGRALYIVDGPTMQAIAVACWGWNPPANPVDIPASWGDKQYQLEVVITGEDVFRAKMYALPPYRVQGAGMALFLLPLVDRRFYECGSLVESTDTPPEDLSTLVDTLAGELNFGGTIVQDPIASEYDAAPVDKRLYQTEVPQPAANLLDVLALSVGMRIVLEPLTNSYFLINQEHSDIRRQARLGFSVMASETSAALMAGGLRGKAALPPSLSVYVYDSSGVQTEKVPTFPGGSTVGVPRYPVYTTWQETASNATETTAFVNKLASDMAEWANSGAQYSIAGAINYFPSGYDDYFSIQILEGDLNGDGTLDPIMRSRVYELPPLFGPWVYLVGGELEDCGGGTFRYCILAEDASTSKSWVWARRGLRDEDTGSIGLDPDDTDLFKLYFMEYELSSPVYAKAGYKCKYAKDSSGLWAYLTGPCIDGCQTDSTLDLDLPDGAVDEEYAHTVTGTGVTDIDVIDLPDGLTFDAETSEITGTPTTAGTCHVVITATGGNGCTITKIQDVNIAEAE